MTGSIFNGVEKAVGYGHGDTEAGEVDMMYVAILEQADDGAWSAYVPDLPGCTSWGRTRAEVKLRVKDAVETYVESLREDNAPIPPARSFPELVEVA